MSYHFQCANSKLRIDVLKHKSNSGAQHAIAVCRLCCLSSGCQAITIQLICNLHFVACSRFHVPGNATSELVADGRIKKIEGLLSYAIQTLTLAAAKMCFYKPVGNAEGAFSS